MIRSSRRLSLFMLLVSTAFAPPAGADPLFGTPTPFEVAPIEPLVGEEAPHDLAVGDVNEDGNPDVVLPNYTLAGTISVALGNGDGTFSPRQDYPCSEGNLRLTLSDFNGDGHLDVAAMNYAGEIWLLTGHGDGTFATGVQIGPTPYGNPDIEAGDLNGDGNQDLVAGVVFLGNGDGTFEPSGAHIYGTTLAIGDVNRDGMQDVVVPPFGGWMPGTMVYLGKGDGTFADARIYPMSSRSVNTVSIADVDSDNWPDLVMRTFDGIYVALNDGSGEFPVSTYYYAAAGDYTLYGLGAAVGDLNADCILDIAVSGTVNGPGLSVLLGTIDNIFGDIVYVRDRTYGSGISYAVAVSDLNSDGRLDLVSVGESLVNIGPFPPPLPPMELPTLSIRVAGPFGKSLTVRYRTPSTASAGIEVFDVLGRLVERRVTQPGSSGWQDTSFALLRSGMYFVRLRQDGRSVVSRGVVVR